ncbi:DUF4366 domain-containing protein [Proteiniborus sp. MB09-C3]|uniref:DUF4366 domain-containing protein n=1 Tax=Proteiniborus sp. MB09-C3 TaxID=3050072 RepID=UPI0025562EC8|nr:DUF4366 domain-containing protein [Proteiniborus sp. MB09-C3]WIV13772.1 DUF4366 domain-containing protein [Proteiniborus sp. MB09-C3]
MKNKKLFRSFFVLLAALILMGGFSVTAYAGGGEDIPTDDSNVIVETAEPQPLTPEGNMSLVDDIAGAAAEDKQFIVVQSKGGNYFYIIIDNAAQGENTVHFLNQVDESDLMALIDEDKLPQNSEATPQPTPEPTPQPEPEQPKEEKSNTGGTLLMVLLLFAGIGGAFYYFKVLKPKQAVKGNTDLDEFDFDEYDKEAGDEQPETDEEEQEDEE